MSKSRKLFKVLFAAVALGGVAFLSTGCSSMDVSYNPNFTAHEGMALPQLVVNSNGTAEWDTDTDGKFVAGKHTYQFKYTDARNGKTKVGSFEFEASQHQSGEDDITIIKQPDCTEDGIQYHKCQICETLYNQESIPALGHDFTVPVHIDGDCMTKGYTYNTCSRCQEKEKTAAGDLAITYDTTFGAHTWAESSTTTEDPTCQVEGHAIVYCTNHEAHQAGQGSQEQDYKYISIDPVTCDFTEEHHTDGDCMHYGYTEYTCKWCHEYKMAEGSTTEHYKKYDTTYGAHIWETNDDGSFKANIVTTPTCQEEGTGYVKCIYHEQHAQGQGLTSETTKDILIPVCEHNFVEKVYAPYSMTTCRTLGEYKLKCQWCDTFEPNTSGVEYNHQDEEYLSHHYDENGLCDNVYYEVLVDPKSGKTVVTTRICGACKDEVEKEYNLGGSRAYSQKDGQWHDGTMEDPSDSVVAKIVKEHDASGAWTGKYILYILATEKETDDESVKEADYNCYINTYPVTTWVKDRTMATNFETYGPSFIPWYEDLDENYHLYRDLIVRVEISPEIQSLPAGLFANLNGLETITMEGLSSLEELPAGLFYNCENLTFVGINDNTKVIGVGTFYDCPSFSASSLVFPNQLTTIKEYAFYKTFIGDIDLSNCKNLEFIGYAAFQNSTGGTNTVILPSAKININLGSMTSNTYASNQNSGSFNSKGFAVFVEDDFDETEYLNSISDNVYVGLTSTYFLGKGNKYEDMVLVVDGVEMLFPTAEKPIYAKHSLAGNNEKYTYLVEKYEDGVIICNTLDKSLTDERLEAVMNYVYDGTNKVKDKLVCIGNQAFTDCKKITRFEVSTSLKEIRDLAFCDCTRLKEIGVSQGEGKLLDFDESLTNLTSIGCRAFEGTALQRVTLPKTLKYLGAALFINCTSLKDIYYDAQYEAYVYYNGTLLEDQTERYVEIISCSYDNRGILGGLSQTTGLTIHISENVSHLNRTIFAYNSAPNLKIDFTNATNVVAIDELCFDSLKCRELDFSNTQVTSIGRMAFASMYYLEKVTFPAGVVFDDVYGATNAMFYDTTSLREIHLNGNITTNQYAFGSYDANAEIKVYVAPTVTELPYMLTGGKVNLVIELANNEGTFTGYSLVNNEGTYTSNFDGTNIFKTSTVNVSFLYKLDGEPQGTSFTTSFTTTYPVEIVIGQNATNIPENYFAGLPSTTKVTLDENCAYVFFDENDSKYHYCGIDKAFTTGVKFYVNGVEVTKAHMWDESTYTPATCEDDSQGYRLCKICGERDETITPKAGHNYQISFDELTTATCQAEGNIHWVCENCGKDYVEEGKTIDHKWEETDVSCLEVGYKAQCIYCEAYAEETYAEGHYAYDSENNKFVMIATEDGEYCYFCGQEVLGFALGDKGVTGQLFDRETENTSVTLLVTSSGEGDTTYSFTDTATSPLWKYRNSYEECIIGSKIVNISQALYWNGGVMSQSAHTGYVYRLVIGENVKTIGAYAFMGLYYLNEIHIKSNLESISNDVFFLANMDESKALSLYFDEGVTEIPEAAFYCGNAGYSGIKNIYLPSTLKSIGDYVFYGFNGSREYSSPNQNLYFQGTIDQWVGIDMASPDANPALTLYNVTFYVNGEKLNAVQIGADCTDIKPYTLNIPGIKTVVVDPTNTKYKVVNGALIDIEAKTLIYASSNYIPDDGSVETIGVAAFSGSTISNIVIPDSVKTIKQFAFYNCATLNTVDLGSGVETIGEYAFYGDTLLKTIYVPKTLTYVGAGAFGSCSALANVCYAGTQEEFNAITVDTHENYNEKFKAGFCPFYDKTGKSTQELASIEGQRYWYIDSEGNRTLVPSTHTYEVREATAEERANCIDTVTYCTFCGTEIKHEGHTIGQAVELPDCMTGGTLKYECEVCHASIDVEIKHVGHYNSKGEIITTPGERCAYCGKIVYDVMDLGDDGVVAQFTSHEESKSLFDCIVVSSSTGTVVREFSTSSSSDICKKYYSSLVSLTISDDITAIGKNAFGRGANITRWIRLEKLYVGKNVASIGTMAFAGFDYCKEVYWNCNVSAEASNTTGPFMYLGLGLESGTNIYIGKNVTIIPGYMFYGVSNNGVGTHVANIYFENGTQCVTINRYAFAGNRASSFNLSSMILSKDLTTLGSYVFAETKYAVVNSNMKVFFTGNSSDLETFKTKFTSLGGYFWNSSTKENIVQFYFYTEEAPQEAGNYWHYAEDGFTPVIWEVE